MIHPDTKEVNSLQASPAAKALIEEMQDVLRNEQAWGIAEKHLEMAFARGFGIGREEGFKIRQLLDPPCGGVGPLEAPHED